MPVITAVRVIAEDIKLSHSVFALPFAVLAASMAAFHAGSGRIDWADFWTALVLVVIAMIFARTAAMLANRIVDHRIDAGNPRTRGRAIPSGRLSLRTATIAFALASAGFLLVCLLFGLLRANWWPAILGLPVLVWITSYGLFKRFTWFCHLWLGASLALSPVASAIAVDPGSLAGPSIWALAGMVLCWVAGFDVIYALQDLEVDRRDGLNSIPARFGFDGALWISRGLHLVAVVLLFVAARTEPGFGVGFTVAAVVVAVLLAIEHATVRRWGTT
ncbi:MAG: UbiA-like polyprenyltransferase, partial [Planctomycetota bacterium]|nr:UbiA-like polyprenyltransferase [Planctomycetota bacterium]